ncbi:efflux RND transporter periplasmic adaptor subunit [Undibacterium oligocarboniphilum]|uniref:Efflux RND transporter periplasmic adaptor subunit n=1 Tax=Undibacterium oligocarboniphilum TaxID=666702 RepID=A0A850QG42_9BURK|nr:efflux RND transporter periplasmic adaptor subunit [Undibacterium oligocarboniphilum]MBC3870667.1 efflux RND transporter periplasmic adaptor subunit [Undibacterium oligocarboniphilum]NVO78531.1 efflux RND transporter periplasmic adaptor subunit [Undibacterium oligocarboniphilum]
MLTTRKKWLIAVLASVAAGLAITAFVSRKHAVDPVPASAVQAAARTSAQPVQVLEFLPSDVTVVQQGDVSRLLSLSGALRAFNQAQIKARVAGDVRDVLVREGESVQAGQVVIRMDPSDYEARLAQAQGALAAAQGQLDIARQARDNNQALLAKNFISKNAYDNGVNQYAIAVANVDSAKGVLAVAQKALADTQVRAPMAGLISNRSVQPGEKISADNRLLDVVDLRTMELEAAVPAMEISHLRVGQQVQVRIEGIASPVEGKVVRINPATVSGSRSIMAYVQIVNPDLQLRAGMFAQAELVVEKKSGVLLIPQAAVQYEAGKPFVYAIDNNTVQQKWISPGLAGDSQGNAVIEVSAGLTQGMTIVRNNLGSMRAGIPVRLVPLPAPAVKG